MEGKPEEASVADPLDDGAFFYFVRTVPLKVGESYTFQRYFKAEKNPVIVKVLRLDTVTVKAGRFPCIVIQPIIKSGGIFAEGGEALMWLSDDDKRMLVQMKTKVPILKSLDLYLKSVTAGARRRGQRRASRNERPRGRSLQGPHGPDRAPSEQGARRGVRVAPGRGSLLRRLPARPARRARRARLSAPS